MSRVPSAPILVLIAGTVSISVGLLFPWGNPDGARAAEPPADAPSGAPSDAPSGAPAGAPPAAPGRGPLSIVPRTVERIEIEVLASNAREGGPASGAKLALWRRASGEGPTYRSGERLTPTPILADANGRAVVKAPAGVPLRLVARTADGGPPTALDLGPLRPGERSPLRAEIDLQPAPEPLEVLALDAAGSPLPGARLHLVGDETPRWSEFPGTNTIASRTDGAGRCTLDGRVRAARWVVVEAAGHAPAVLRVRDIERVTRHTFRLGPEVRAEVFVRTEGDGAPVEGARVELRFELEGLAAARSAARETQTRGGARIRHLPAGVELVPVVTLESGAVERFAPVTLTPPTDDRTSDSTWSRVELVVP